MKGIKILDCSNVTLQRHGARHIYVVPNGLKELMMDISREVLRCKPEHIYTFCADYCDALLITRENARVAAKVIESITDCSITIAELLQKTGIDRVKANQKAVIIQKAFRKYLAQHDVHKEIDKGSEEHMISQLLAVLDMPIPDIERTVNIIKSAYRAYKERREIFCKADEFVNWRKALQNTMYIYRKTGVPDEIIRRAASTIKAAYRGYYTRRQLANAKRRYSDMTNTQYIAGCDRFPPEVMQAFEHLQIHPLSKEVEDAVIKIQHVVRRYLAKISAEYIAKDVLRALSDRATEPFDYREQQRPSLSKKHKPLQDSRSDSLLTHEVNKIFGQKYFQSESSSKRKQIVKPKYSTGYSETRDTSPLKEEIVRKRDTKPDRTIRETRISPTTRRVEELVKHAGSSSEYKRVDTITPTAHLRREKMKNIIVDADHQSVRNKTVVTEHFRQKIERDDVDNMMSDHVGITKTGNIRGQTEETANLEESDTAFIRMDTITPTSHLRKVEIRKKIIAPDRSVIQKFVASEKLQKEFGIDEILSDDYMPEERKLGTIVKGLRHTETSETRTPTLDVKEKHTKRRNGKPKHTIHEIQLTPDIRQIQETVKREGSDTKYQRIEIISPDSHMKKEQITSVEENPGQYHVEKKLKRKEYHRKLNGDEQIQDNSHNVMATKEIPEILLPTKVKIPLDLKRKAMQGGNVTPEHTIIETQLSPDTRQIHETVKREGSATEYERIEIISPDSHMKKEQITTVKDGPNEIQIQTKIERKQIRGKIDEDEGQSSGQLSDRPIEDIQTTGGHTIKETQLSQNTRQIEETIRRAGSDTAYQRIEIISPHSHMKQEQIIAGEEGPGQIQIQRRIERKQIYRPAKIGNKSGQLLPQSRIPSEGVPEGVAVALKMETDDESLDDLTENVSTKFKTQEEEGPDTQNQRIEDVISPTVHLTEEQVTSIEESPDQNIQVQSIRVETKQLRKKTDRDENEQRQQQQQEVQEVLRIASLDGETFQHFDDIF